MLVAWCSSKLKLFVCSPGSGNIGTSDSLIEFPVSEIHAHTSQLVTENTYIFKKM